MIEIKKFSAKFFILMSTHKHESEAPDEVNKAIGKIFIEGFRKWTSWGLLGLISIQQGWLPLPGIDSSKPEIEVIRRLDKIDIRMGNMEGRFDRMEGRLDRALDKRIAIDPYGYINPTNVVTTNINVPLGWKFLSTLP